MTLRDDLIAAKALIDTPEKWGKGTSAYTSLPNKPLCAHGACRRLAHVTRRDEVEFSARQKLREVLPDVWPESRSAITLDGIRTVPDFNDHPDTTHADIMALFDRAIAAADLSPSNQTENTNE